MPSTLSLSPSLETSSSGRLRTSHGAVRITPKAYVARYDLNEAKNDLDEVILATDTHWSDRLDALFDKLVKEREPNWKTAPMIQGWYSSQDQVVCMATTNQPFRLE